DVHRAPSADADPRRAAAPPLGEERDEVRGLFELVAQLGRVVERAGAYGRPWLALGRPRAGDRRLGGRPAPVVTAPQRRFEGGRERAVGYVEANEEQSQLAQRGEVTRAQLANVADEVAREEDHDFRRRCEDRDRFKSLSTRIFVAV